MRWLGRPAPVAQAGPDQRRGQALPAPPGAPDLALFRRSGQRRDQLAAAGQFATGAARRSGAANLAHQYRTVADLGAGGARISAISPSTISWIAARRRWRRSTGWNATKGIFSTGTTPRRCEPLTPRYVSTVDSGNLLASLWVFERGCRDLLHAPLLSHVRLARSRRYVGSSARGNRARSVDGGAGAGAAAAAARQGGGP